MSNTVIEFKNVSKTYKLYKSDKNMYYTQKNRRITNYIVDKSYYFK